MKRIAFSRQARRDMDAIWSYIAERDMDAADRMIDRIERATRFLSLQPLAGGDAGVLKLGLRKWTVGPHVIFYAVIGVHLRVIRIVHDARDLPELDFV